MILDGLGDLHEAAVQRQNLANLLAVAGRVEEAGELARGLVDTVLELRSPTLTMAFANTYMNILIRGRPGSCGRLFGAEEAMRERLATPNPYQDEGARRGPRPGGRRHVTRGLGPGPPAGETGCGWRTCSPSWAAPCHRVHVAASPTRTARFADMTETQREPVPRNDGGELDTALAFLRFAGAAC